ncbi:unnamed protein product [Cylicocyclus nassatus]|uniref:Uncharacterized protein n=1 Tax=Cylicocyclus nassatus TaxID=53992 RepID=A0AA36GLS5_CYLNA|nr:unnamed protein product [Cylicocyclus nassatus]
MNKQVQDNMLSVIQKFLTNAPPGCDVEISVKYNLAKEGQQVQAYTTTMKTMEPVSSKLRNADSSGSTTLLVRKLRSEERVPIKGAVPVLSPKKIQEDTSRYENLPEGRKLMDDEVNVSAEVFKKSNSDKKKKMKTTQSSDPETDEIATSELFPVKKALRYNKNSGKYDDISY